MIWEFLDSERRAGIVIFAGYRGAEVFDKKCCTLLFKASRGTPRIVNVLCHKALMLAYGEGTQQVTASHIYLAIKDTEAAYRINKTWLVTLLASAATLAVLSILYLALYGWPL